MAGRSSWGNSLIILIVFALLASLSVWSNYAELDSVTRGDGRVISSMQNQSVQAGEGGIILRRYVSENSSVSKGELLFEIDPIDAASELNQMFTKAQNGSGKNSHAYDKSGKTMQHYSIYELETGDNSQIVCLNWSDELEKKGHVDELNLTIGFKEYGDFVRFRAYD